MMELQGGDFRLHRVSTKIGRPTIRKHRPLTPTERQRRWRRNKTAKAQRIAARKERDEADRAASAVGGGINYGVHHIGINEYLALDDLRRDQPEVFKRVRSEAASLFEAGTEALRIVGPARDTWPFAEVKRLWPNLTPEERAELARETGPAAA
jgi:hypothetical protein